MATLNRVFLIGNLTRDPDVRYLPSGKALAEVRLAVSRRYRAGTGEDEKEVCFVDVLAWGRQGEVCGQYLSKGSPLFVDGRLLYDEWEKDGKRSSRLRVVADRIQLIGAPRRAEYSDAADSPPEAAPVTVPASPVEKAPDAADEDDLPF